jgi:hypothetical protein
MRPAWTLRVRWMHARPAIPANSAGDSGGGEKSRMIMIRFGFRRGFNSC